MQMAAGENSEFIVSRVMDELANTYYEMGKLDEAEKAFRDLLFRFVNFYSFFDSSCLVPQFLYVVYQESYFICSENIICISFL